MPLQFFYANATVRYRRNLITQIADDSEASFTNHGDKAALIWNSFRDRLGKSDFTSTLFDLSQHFTSQMDLSQLVEPTEKAEIDQVVRLLPSNKAPGPDGFNTDFIKRC